jgi:hypothetical protein
LGLAELDSMHAFDDHADSLERPQLRAKSMLGGILQNGTAHFIKLRCIKLGRSAPQRYCT